MRIIDARVPLAECEAEKGKGVEISLNGLYLGRQRPTLHTLSRAVQSAQRGLTSVFRRDRIPNLAARAQAPASFDNSSTAARLVPWKFIPT
jgi:hypothetical protein